MLDARFVPIATPLPAPKGGYRSCPFKAGYGSTLDSLERELAHLAGTDLVVEVDIPKNHIRNDGFPYSYAKAATPGVRISFVSKHGPLVYQCATYPHWEDNIRAVALTLERLRAVERYGASAGGEQYKGWAQLPPGQGVRIQGDEWGSVEDAARFIIDTAVAPNRASVHDVDLAVGSVELVLKAWFKDAAKRAHPDVGGSAETMAKLNRARDFVESALRRIRA